MDTLIILSMDDYMNALRLIEPKSTIPVQVNREGKVITTKITFD